MSHRRLAQTRQLDVTRLDGPLLLDAANQHRGVGILRTPRRIAGADTVDAIGLSLVLDGTMHVSGGGRALELRRGDLCLLDSREPWEKTLSDDYREQFIFLPRAFAEAHIGGPFAVVGPLVAPHQGLGRFADPRFATRSISEIAFACGFNDAAHFSRSFKARFGVTPREIRAASRRR